MEIAEFITAVSSLIEPVKSALGLFLEPPMLYFVAAGGLTVAIGLAKKLVPVKRR